MINVVLGGLFQFGQFGIGFMNRLAHEVYVLSPQDIIKGEHDHSVNPWSALLEGHNFLLALAFAIGICGSLLFALYLKRKPLFQKIGAFLDKATIIAPDIIRIAFGASLLMSAYHGALFGPEQPLSGFVGAEILKWILIITGVSVVAGFRVRFFGLVSILIWQYGLITEGMHMFTYINYLAEAIAIILLPVQFLTLDKFIYKLRGKKPPVESFGKYSLTITRFGFALALLYTAIDVKFLNAALPLEVVNQYELTRFFPFTPLFIVLGAGLVEILIAVLYGAGLLRRMTTLIFLVFVTLSIIFFKESVWPHYLLLALGVGIFLHEPDPLALDGMAWLNGKPCHNKKIENKSSSSKLDLHTSSTSHPRTATSKSPIKTSQSKPKATKANASSQTAKKIKIS